MLKRMMDIFISFTGIMLCLPIFITVAATIRFGMGKPILFKQKRPGLNGKPFNLHKFRTMETLLDKRGNMLSDEARLTPLGIFLRKYSLDELPQLINVLKGDMSTIGPRPLLMEYLPLYNKEQLLRHAVKPGITGWAQVNGRNAIEWEEKFKLDLWYVKNQSLVLDGKILILTLFKVFKHEGISSKDSATMEKFNGTKEVL